MEDSLKRPQAQRHRQPTWIPFFFSALIVFSAGVGVSPGVQIHETRKRAILDTSGLVAFWDFEHAEDNVWTSRSDPRTSNRSFPLYLRQIGDEKNYSVSAWPYREPESKIVTDSSGPLGKAVRFNQGHIYGAVPRDAFDGTSLDLHGERPFTVIAWVKFIGERHMVAGIWDEGGWEKYAGRRQVALFAGLFRQKGVIGHVSATGAASYPQSNVDGAQYARVRAIDGRAFENDQWVAMAMSYDPDKNEVRAFLNGEMSPLKLADPVTQDVFRYPSTPSANPLAFEGPIYSPRSFVLKYNGYSLATNGVSEHRVHVDLDERTLTYRRAPPATNESGPPYRISLDIHRTGRSILSQPILLPGIDGQTRELTMTEDARPGDLVTTTLELLEDGQWKRVGAPLKSRITTGAPFTFGRALGLDAEEIGHGSQLHLDGIAVFDRSLTEGELEHLSFVPTSENQ